MAQLWISKLGVERLLNSYDSKYPHSHSIAVDSEAWCLEVAEFMARNMVYTSPLTRLTVVMDHKIVTYLPSHGRANPSRITRRKY